MITNTSASTLHMQALDFAKGRVHVILAFLAYALALNITDSQYLFPVWGYFGFSYVQPSLLAYLYEFVLVVWGALIVPRQLSRASDIVALIFGVIVYVPTIVITLALTEDALSQYGITLFCTAISFALICLPSQLAPDAKKEIHSEAPRSFIIFAVSISAILCMILVIVFNDSLAIVSFTDAYDQRWKNSTSDRYVTYSLSYLTYVFIPILISLGYTIRHWTKYLLILAGGAGSLLIYSIGAQKIVLLYPFIIMVLFFVNIPAHRFLGRTTVIVVGLSLLILSVTAAPFVRSYYGLGAPLQAQVELPEPEVPEKPPVAPSGKGSAKVSPAPNSPNPSNPAQPRADGPGYLDLISAYVAASLVAARSFLAGVWAYLSTRGWWILYPPAIFVSYLIVARVSSLYPPRAFIGLVAIVGVLGVVVLALKASIATWAATLLVHRTIAIPALTLSQYQDFFSEAGWTFWSHVKGFSLLISPPYALAEQPSWPNLGMIVGHHVYQTNNDLNANPFASDGVAAAGPMGVLMIGAAIGVWLFLLNRVSARWNQNFVMLVLFPVSIALTNAPFFTTLLSFGGLFWLFAFYIFDRGNSLWGRRIS